MNALTDQGAKGENKGEEKEIESNGIEMERIGIESACEWSATRYSMRCVTSDRCNKGSITISFNSMINYEM